MANHTSRGARDVTVIFSTWGPIGDLRLFRGATILHGEDVYRYVYNSLEINVPLSDRVFEPPQ